MFLHEEVFINVRRIFSDAALKSTLVHLFVTDE